jgi:hypothetical protein
VSNGAHIPTKVVEAVIRLHQDWLPDYIPIHKQGALHEALHYHFGRINSVV